MNGAVSLSNELTRLLDHEGGEGALVERASNGYTSIDTARQC